MDTKEAYTEKMIEALQNLTKELGGLCSQMDTLVQEAGKLVQEYQKNRQTVVENLAGARNEAAKAFTGTEAENNIARHWRKRFPGSKKRTWMTLRMQKNMQKKLTNTAEVPTMIFWLKMRTDAARIPWEPCLTGHGTGDKPGKSGIYFRG